MTVVQLPPKIYYILPVTLFRGATAQLGPRPPHCSGSQIAHNYTNKHTHTHTHTRARARALGLLWSACRAGLYLHDTQQTQVTNIHDRNGIRTRDPINQANADLSLRHHDHWDSIPGKIQWNVPPISGVPQGPWTWTWVHEVHLIPVQV
jgi:hypothetical protein